MKKHWHHKFYRFPFCVYWRLIQEHEPRGCIASGWARTRDDAWDASIAAIPKTIGAEDLEAMREAANLRVVRGGRCV